MGSVAAGMIEKGYSVTGSDQAVYPPMSTFLESKGVQIMEGYRADNIPAEATTVVIGNAISRGNDEAEAILDRRLRYMSLPEVLKEYFLRGRRNYVISGTHGKTTTSSMLAWVFESAGKDPSFMIGGIPENFGQGARFTDSEFVVMEGDEYDTEGGIYFPLSCENCDCRMERGDTNEYGGMNPVCATCRDELSADETAGE